MSRLVRLATCDVVLVRRARYGDRGAARRLAARHLDRITLLASVVGTSPEESVALARQGFALALRGGRPFDDALVAAFNHLAVTVEDPDAAQGRLVLLLVEVDQRPADIAAGLLGLTADEVTSLLPAARASAGATHPTRACRGWGLVSRRNGLTDAEHEAGNAHLALCRRCRDRVAALDRTRAQLLGGSAGVAGAVAAVQLVPLGGSAAAGAGALVTSKAAVGLVGALGAAVLATGGTTAVVHQTHHRTPAARPAPALETNAPAPRTGSTTRPPAVPIPQPAPTSTTLPSLPSVQLPTTGPSPVLPLPAPLPTTLPKLPLVDPLVDPLPSLVASLLKP